MSHLHSLDFDLIFVSEPGIEKWEEVEHCRVLIVKLEAESVSMWWFIFDSSAI